MVACHDPAIQDKSLLNKNDYLTVIRDTVPIRITTVYETPLISTATSVGVLGNLVDNNMGKTYSGFYAQCQTTSNGVYFGLAPLQLDSVVLSLAYSSQYGQFTKPVNVYVYEVAQDMSGSVNYYTNTGFQVKTPPIGQLTGFVPNISDSVSILGQNYAPELRVRLSNAFGNKILFADSAALSTDSNFLEYFKGFYITTSSSSRGNGEVYFDLTSAISGITLYYRSDGQDSLLYTLPITGVTVNHFDNLYAGAPVSNVISHPNPVTDPKVYIQGGAGLKGKIVINTDSIPRNIAVNNAELILAQSPFVSDTGYPAPLVLNLYRIDDAGQPQALDDASLPNSGGALQYDSVSPTLLSIPRYHFIIKDYFQKLAQGIYKNNGLYVEDVSANTNSQRLVISNSGNFYYKVSLVVTYTKL